MQTQNNATRIHTVVIGGGQAGLAVGYHLARRGVRFLILDAGQRVGDAWRNRWDSLRLFTPARYVNLPGFRLPARGDSFPSKEQMADYLEAYSRRFHLPVRTGLSVDRVSRRGDRFLVSAGTEQFEAENVVVAMANSRNPARRPSPKIFIHPSSSCIARTIATQISFNPATCSSSALETLPPISPSNFRALTPR